MWTQDRSCRDRTTCRNSPFSALSRATSRRLKRNGRCVFLQMQRLRVVFSVRKKRIDSPRYLIMIPKSGYLWKTSCSRNKPKRDDEGQPSRLGPVILGQNCHVVNQDRPLGVFTSCRRHQSAGVKTTGMVAVAVLAAWGLKSVVQRSR